MCAQGVVLERAGKLGSGLRGLRRGDAAHRGRLASFRAQPSIRKTEAVSVPAFFLCLAMFDHYFWKAEVPCSSGSVSRGVERVLSLREKHPAEPPGRGAYGLAWQPCIAPGRAPWATVPSVCLWPCSAVSHCSPCSGLLVSAHFPPMDTV